MDLGKMTERDEAANSRAKFYPAVDATVNDGEYAPPGIEIDNAQVYAFVQDGVLVVSVDLRDAGAAFDKYGDELVPVVVELNGTTVFQLTNTQRSPEHEETIAVLVRAARPRRTLANLFGLLG